jgi:aminoglycoside/choline kinase family phosphotransferase
VNDPLVGPYTRERFTDELGIFREWFVGRSLPAGVEEVLTVLVDRAVNQPQCCIHRDYHCRNLLFEDGRLGVVDFQDALMGPASYDLASLLHDCYHTFPDPEVEHWTDYYLSRSQLFLKRKTFAKDLAFMAVQRQLKAVGIFARLKLRDGKPSHLGYIQPVLERVRTTAAGYRKLEPLGEWLDQLDVTARVQELESAGSP